MKHILVIHGPNLNMLGKRDQKHYGASTLAHLNDQISKCAVQLGVKASFYQSNHEGDLIDFIQAKSSSANGILINPGALTHYGYALRDALVDCGLPIVEVHLSDILHREPFRKIDVLEGIVIERIVGLKEQSYVRGLERLVGHITTLH